MSDAEISASVPTTVAMNADHHFLNLATHVYTGCGLREAPERVRARRWLGYPRLRWGSPLGMWNGT
jgi:phosphoserine phosphatase